MPEIDAYFYSPAVEFYENEATAEEQDEIDRIIQNICENPGIDNQVKFWFPVSPAVFSLYADARYWVVYHQRNNFTIGVLNVGRGPQEDAQYPSGRF